MTKIISVVVGLIILSAACKNENDTVIPKRTEIGPGTTWVYEISNFNEAGAITYVEEDTLVAEEQTISGSKWLVLINQTSGLPVTSYQKRNDSWWTMPYGTSTPGLFVKDPASLNDQWLVTQLNGAIDTAKVKDIDLDINVLGAQYNGCTHFQTFDHNGLTYDYYYRQNIIVPKVVQYLKKSTGDPYIFQTVELKTLFY